MDFRAVERKWQNRWAEAKVFEANINKKKKKFFITIPFPYMNGSPHVGHTFTFSRGDVYARFKRMQGYNVLFPQAFHATGEPILGTIERLQQNDQTQIETFKLFGATDEDLENFVKNGPEFVAKYWMQKWIENFKMMGFSIDWRRSFVTAITPAYNKFIAWQYNTLRKKHYVVQGTHPVVWCPHDQSPTGDHDRLVGEGESPIEFVILKFRLENGDVIPCATLRPETIYGVTNIWIDPDITYFKAKVNGEIWYISKDAVEKLKDQLRKIEVVDRISGEKLIGEYVENPATKVKVPILPAYFVDPKTGTGIVMSVPAHAPYDWIGLRELQLHPERATKYNVPEGVVKNLHPISIIDVDGFGENPAVDISEKMKIESEGDIDKLDKATNELYKKEFHTGLLKSIFGKYAGQKVSDVKEKIVKDFERNGFAETMWELTGPVICRCNTPNHVKILENQWFLKFSDNKWKSLVKKNLSQMKLYPEESRIQFENTIDWLEDKACTRKTGLGTPLPWDPEWKIETLSDSTIYMAFYIIAHFLNSGKISAKQLTDEIFDLVFLNRGTVASVSKKSGINKKTLQEMRKEFTYFYPVDLRNSAKELIPNHLTFMLFHHTAIWPQKFWPKAFSVNGFVQVSGEKMAKSKGNIIPLRKLVEDYGADMVRMNIVSSNEDMNDAGWKSSNIESFTSRLDFVEYMINNIGKASRSNSSTTDIYLKSRLQTIIDLATKNYEELKFRSAITHSFYKLLNDLKWYIDRSEGVDNCNSKILKKVLSCFIKLNAPILPHIAEEFWEMLGEKEFVALAKWPESNKKLINKNVELSEQLLEKTLQDVRQIQKITGVKPIEVLIFVAPKWKFELYKHIIKNKSVAMEAMIKYSMEKIKSVDKQQLVKFIQTISKKLNELPKEFVDRKTQLKIFTEAKRFLEQQLKTKVVIEEAEKSTEEKAKQADVLKPAILLRQ